MHQVFRGLEGARKKLIACLEGFTQPFEAGEQPHDVALAIRAWNVMGGLDFNALEFVVEMLGVRDPEALVLQLIVIRDFYNRQGA